MNNPAPQLPVAARAALAECFAHIRIVRATDMAQSKRFLEAEALLSPNGELPESPSELDLLARIAAQHRQFARARQLWQIVLKKDPENEAAKEALDELDSPWIAVAFVRRFACWAGVIVFASLAVLGLFALSSGFLWSDPRQPQISSVSPAAAIASSVTSDAASEPRNKEDQPSRPAVSSPGTPSASFDAGEWQVRLEQVHQIQAGEARSLAAQMQVVQSNQASLLQNQRAAAGRLESLASPLETLAKQQRDAQRLLEQTRNDIASLAQAQAKALQSAPNALVVPRSRASLNFQIKGISVTPQQDQWVISFDTGLFDRDDHFKIGSKTLLESVAKAIVQTQQKLNVEVIGFSENESPTWPWSSPVDRAALAQARAERAKNFFDRLDIFPSGAVTATVGSPEAQPFPGETRLNRTVILRISGQ